MNNLNAKPRKNHSLNCTRNNNYHIYKTSLTCGLLSCIKENMQGCKCSKANEETRKEIKPYKVTLSNETLGDVELDNGAGNA